MIQAVPVRLGKCELFSTPFPQIHSLDALDHHIAAEILEWFETAAPWELIETDFYEQFEFSFDDVDVPDHLGFLKDGAFELAVRQKISKTFNVALVEKVEMVAHKLVPEQRIRIHNDCLEGGETHRLVIHLNSGWTAADGGLFITFGSADTEDVHRVIIPLNNTAIGFEISENSHHAISTVHNGSRYSLVCSFKSLK